MGIAELDLNLFHESLQTIQIRRAAQEDQNLRYALFGKGWKYVRFCSLLPPPAFLETSGEEKEQSELVFTCLASLCSFL